MSADEVFLLGTKLSKQKRPLDGALENFVDLVIPELQSRNLFRTEYAGSTLREHFNLGRPANVHTMHHG